MNAPQSSPPRFFVEVRASNASGLRRLRDYGYDFFSATAREAAPAEFTVDGLLTLDQIGRLVRDGYKVLVTADLESRARGRTEISEFPEWLAARRKSARRKP
jgi:hypothetical protein